MNDAAQKHVDKAAGFLGRGEEFYRKAGEEILVAKESDPTLSNRGIAAKLGKSPGYIDTLVAAAERARQTGEFTMDWRSGSNQRSVVTTKALHAASPEEVEQIIRILPDHARDKVVQAAARVSHKVAEERIAQSKTREREHLGDDVVDGLEFRQELEDTEFLLVKAHGNLRGFAREANRIGITNTPENWRESCLEWVEALEGHLGMARALLSGDDIDWSAFEELLAREGK